ncbi:MAG TPA: hypothetical protein VF095_06225 [Bacillota bacterium]
MDTSFIDQMTESYLCSSSLLSSQGGLQKSNFKMPKEALKKEVTYILEHLHDPACEDMFLQLVDQYQKMEWKSKGSYNE